MMTVAHAELTPHVVDGLYTEAMILADEAHGYFDGPGRQDRDRLPPDERVAFSCESLRVTTRLMHVIAWLLTRRAVAAGEITSLQGAGAGRRLAEVADIEHDTLDRLPGAARAIAEAAAELYARVRRLDHGLDRTPAMPRGPVSGLMLRLEQAF